jgi:hypothetical protein
MHHRTHLVRALLAPAISARSRKASRLWRALTCATLLAAQACESSGEASLDGAGELDRGDGAIAAGDAGGDGDGNARDGGGVPEGSDEPDVGGGASDAGSEQAGAIVGPAGGTVIGPNGARVVIPAGALASDTLIAIEETSDGAPALPTDFAAFGAMFAFTPHGTRFAVPVTVTVPFDAAAVPAGVAPSLLKTNDDDQWEQLANVTLQGDALSAEVTSFSWFDAGDPGLERQYPFRDWIFTLTTLNGVDTVDPPGPMNIGGELHESFDFARNEVFDIDDDGISSLEVFSSADGVDFWASADAPRGSPIASSNFVAGDATLNQSQSFIKLESNATLQFVITEALLEAVDFNGPALPVECPWGFDSLTAVLTDECDMLSARVMFAARAYDEDGPLRKDSGALVLQVGASAEISGRSGLWGFDVGVASLGGGLWQGLWDERHFAFVQDVDGSSGAQHPRAQLHAPMTIDVDLSSVDVGQEFTVTTVVSAHAYNRRGRESGIGAYLRDPSKVRGAAVNMTGLEPTYRPLPPPIEVSTPAPCEGGVDPAAGVLQFSAASYELAEQPFAGTSAVEITRTQGSAGEVSVTFTAAGGTATPGVHFVPQTTVVYFADGDTAPRIVPVEILLDAEAGPDRTVELTLSDAGGCASLGTPPRAVLTILDDDRPPPMPARFTVGGTVNGLVGTGLVLEDHHSLFLEITGDGPFTFTNLPTPSGQPYSVRIFNQPHSPSQVCSVSNGSGTFANANVSDVQVTCVAP